MDQQGEDKIIHRVVRRIADEHGCTTDDTAPDRHPIELDRDKYLKRALALPSERRAIATHSSA